MNLKCFFGNHDWEKISYVMEKFAIDHLLEDKFVKYARKELQTRTRRWKSLIPGIQERKLGQYVCLRCCAVRDDIKDFLDYCRKKGHEKIGEEQEKVRRKEKAEDMVKNCAKGKFKRIFR